MMWIVSRKMADVLLGVFEWFLIGIIRDFMFDFRLVDGVRFHAMKSRKSFFYINCDVDVEIWLMSNEGVWTWFVGILKNFG